MEKNPNNTRTSIMDSAESLMLKHGFGGTTVDAVINQAGVSKGAFFHHFESKADLGRELVKRYAETDLEHLKNTLAKAEGLSDDPLQQLLIFVKLFEQEMDELTEPYPGCLYASFLQQSGLFDDNTLHIIRDSMLVWRKRVLEKLLEINRQHPPAKEVDLESLADMLLVVFEGAFVMSQSLNNNEIITRQLSQYHTYLRLLFDPNK